jgi:hypothetical protein
MKSTHRNLAILLCTIALVSAYFFTQKHIVIDDYDRLML